MKSTSPRSGNIGNTPSRDLRPSGSSGIPDRQISQESEDLLGRGRFARSIAEAILATPAGGTLRLGVYGGWGEGKTSVLELVRSELKGAGHVCVWLAPWIASDRDEFADRLLREMAAELNVDLSALHGAVKKSSWARRLRGAAAEAHVSTKSLDLLLGTSVQAHWDHKVRAAIDDVRKSINAKLGDRKLVVLVDDLDRVRPDLVPGILLTLREALDQPNYFYVMALAPDVVERGLASTHAGWGGPREFLEKIVELPRYLPALTDADVKTFLEGQLARLPELPDTDALRDLIGILPRNPRKLKLMLRHLASIRPLLARFASSEVAWDALYLCQLLRVEFPEEAAALMSDHSTVEDIEGGRMHGRRAEWASEKGAPVDPGSARPEGEYAPKDADQASRFLRICEELRARTSLMRGRYDLSTLMKFPDEVPALTFLEVDQFLQDLDSVPASEQPDRIRARLKSPESDLDPQLAGAFFLALIEIRQEYLNAAADAEMEVDVRGLVTDAQRVLGILQALIVQIGLFRERVLDLESWRRLFNHVASWSHFSRLDYYIMARADERAVLQRAVDELPRDLKSALLPTLRPHFSDTFTAKSQEFAEFVGSLAKNIEHDTAEYILDCLQQPEGLQQFWREYGASARSVLFDPDSVLYSHPELSSRLSAIAVRSKNDKEVQLNFLTFFRMLYFGGHEAGGSIPRNGSRALLANAELLTLIWKSATATALNPRIAGSLRLDREALIRAGTDSALLPRPDWWMRLEGVFFLADESDAGVRQDDVARDEV